MKILITGQRQPNFASEYHSNRQWHLIALSLAKLASYWHFVSARQ